MTQNVDQQEVAHFDGLADQWWDPEGDLRTLHEINPIRLRYITERCPMDGHRGADVGCGGGLLTEALAVAGASMTGIDMSEEAIAVAGAHAAQGGLDITYRAVTVETLADEEPGGFDFVVCMEMLEHVPDPAAIVSACTALVRPGGDVFFSTINRTPAAYALAVVGAEYVLNLVPRGTHDYNKFIRPSELDGWARAAGLALQDLSGLRYDPVMRNHGITGNVQVNYMSHHRRTE